MNKIYKTYQERLINLSSRNASLVLNSLAKKRNFDVLQMDDFFAGRSEEIIDFLLKGKKKVLLLSKPQEWLSHEKKIAKGKALILEKNFSSQYPKYQEIIKTKSKYKEEYTAINFAQVTFSDIEKKKFIKLVLSYLIDEVMKKYEKLLSLSKGLDYLNREINFEINETGISNLYLASDFVEGLFLDGSKCRAPLCMLGVSIVKENGNWYILNNDGNEPDINKVFMLSAKNNNQLKEIDTNFDYSSERDLENQFLAHYKKSGILIENDDEGYCKFPRYRAAESYEKYNNGMLKLKKHIVLGRFPTANAIYEDYEYLISKRTYNKQIKELLGKNSKGNELTTGEVTTETSGGEDLHEENFYFISTLDYSQEIAVKKIDEGENLVVFGPPGTGKSETIANIIADNVSKGKKILMVSQKKAALDVIYNRLSPMKSKIALIHDAEKGKKEFYEKVRLVIEDFEEKYGVDFHYKNRNSVVKTNHEGKNRKIRTYATNIESNLESLRNFVELINKPQKNGESYRELCEKSWKEESLNDEQRQDYEIYLRNKKVIISISEKQEEIELFCKEILEKNLLSKVEVFDSLRKENQYFEKVKSNPDFSIIYELESHIETINNSLRVIEQNLIDVDYKLIYEKIVKNEDVNVEEVLSSKYSYLLDPIAVGFDRFKKMIFSKKELLENEDKNRKTYEKNKSKLFQFVSEINKEIHIISEEASYLDQILRPKEISNLIEDVKTNFTILIYDEFVELRNKYNEYIGLKSEIGELDNSKKKYIRAINRLIEDQNRKDSFVGNFPQIYRLDLLANQIRYQNDVVEIEKCIKNYNYKVSNTKNMMQKKSECVNGYIQELWDEEFAACAKAHPQFREFKRLAGLKSRRRPIRQYFEHFEPILCTMFPVFLMGPETVSKVLPMSKNMFDMILFDEASQMFVEEAIPSLFRGKKVVIAGDDKQLKPSGLFKKTIEEEVDEEIIEDAAALEEESLLDLSKCTYDLSHLRFHYRSHYSELINFSNYAFYDGHLRLSPNIYEHEAMKPIERIYVPDAMWIDRSNYEEATEVVNLIKYILKNRKEEETIGVITFNTNQKDRIFDLIEMEMSRDSEFNEAILKERNRKKGDEDINLFVKNIENVQGDERDIIIFSTGYAKNEKGRLVQQFGTLSQSGGENRLNVAVSRAKKKIYVVTSFEPEELNVENSKQIGPRRFKEYLQYVRAVDQREKEVQDSILKSMVDLQLDSNVGKVVSFDSVFEEEVYERLVQLGYEVHTQIGASGYSIDLGIYDKETSSYICGIECDGKTYHSSQSARERDIHRQKFLESRGWIILRVWSTDWWKDQQSVIENLKRKIDKSLEEKRKKYKNKTSNLSYIRENIQDSKGVVEKLKIEQSEVAEKVKIVESERSKVSKKVTKQVEFGDKVLLRDMDKDLISIEIEKNKYNRHLMPEFHMILLGMNEGNHFEYKGYEYVIESVERA